MNRESGGAGESGTSTRSLTPLKRWNLRSGPDEDATRLGAGEREGMPRRASSDLLHTCHRELLPPWRGLPSLLLLPSPCFTLINTRFSPSLLPLTPYLRVPQIAIPTSHERLGARDSEVLDWKWWSPISARGRAAVVGPRFPGANQHGIVREVMMLGGARKRCAGARSLCCSPRCSDGLWSGARPGHSANYVPQLLSRDFSQRALALAGAKRGARSLKNTLLSSRALGACCLTSLFSLPFLSLSFPSFPLTCKDGNGLDETPNKRPSLPVFGCIGVLMHRLGCAAAGTVRAQVNFGLKDLPSLSSCLGCVDVSRPNATSVADDSSFLSPCSFVIHFLRGAHTGCPLFLSPRSTLTELDGERR
ncbi:hypothetical protein B0H13DRAFT_2343678 [Mycena leptocephala]|nr:hypothetical protein B0H13DRAFT_2343678 [Mycena leptocephala]